MLQGKYQHLRFKYLLYKSLFLSLITRVTTLSVWQNYSKFILIISLLVVCKKNSLICKQTLFLRKKKGENVFLLFILTKVNVVY